MRILVALLFLCSVARGQFLSPGLDWSAVPSHKPDLTDFSTLNTNLFLRLRSSKLDPTNFVSSWVDEIQGVQFNQGDATKQPTNSAFGVYFNGSSSYLTNSELLINGISYNVTFLMVLKLNTAGTAFGGVLLHDKNLSVNTDGIYIGGGSSDLITKGVNSVASQITDNVGSSYYGDILSLSANSPADYTNNIADGRSVVIASGFKLDMIGDGSLHNAKYKGYMQEVVVWTNANFNAWDATVRSNLHYYVTNTYPITP